MAATRTEHMVRQIDATLVDAGNNDRKQFDPAALQALAASIAENGLGQPITLRPAHDGRYEIVAGERRFRAMTTVLGWERVPAIVRHYDDRQASAIMLAENTGRVDLNIVEEARAYAARIDDHGLSVDDVAAWAGVPAFRVRWRLELLQLDDRILDLVASGNLSAGNAREMAQLDTNLQHLALRALNTQNLTAVAFKALCARLAAEQATQTMFDADDFLAIEEYANTAAAATAARASRQKLVALLAAAADQVDGELAHEIAAVLAAEPSA